MTITTLSTCQGNASRKALRRRIPPGNPIIRFSSHPPDWATVSPDLRDLKDFKDLSVINDLNANV